jgi:hypothetical protein
MRHAACGMRHAACGVRRVAAKTTEAPFQPGETVQFRIGGPIMVVVEDRGGTILCA